LDTWDNLQVVFWAPQDIFSECSVLGVEEAHTEMLESLLTRPSPVELPDVLSRAEILVHLMEGHDLGSHDAVTVLSRNDIQDKVDRITLGVNNTISVVERKVRTARTPSEYRALLAMFDHQPAHT